MSEAHAKPNYGLVFIALFVLTIIEIFVASSPIAKLLIVLALITLAMIKAAMVAMFYMHLRFEKILLTVIALAPLLFSILLVLIIGHDIGHSRPPLP